MVSISIHTQSDGMRKRYRIYGRSLLFVIGTSARMMATTDVYHKNPVAVERAFFFIIIIIIIAVLIEVKLILTRAYITCVCYNTPINYCCAFFFFVLAHTVICGVIGCVTMRMCIYETPY